MHIGLKDIKSFLLQKAHSIASKCLCKWKWGDMPRKKMVVLRVQHSLTEKKYKSPTVYDIPVLDKYYL